MRVSSSRNTLNKVVLRNQIDKIRLLFNKDRESYFCFYRILGFFPRNIRYYKEAVLHKSVFIRSEADGWSSWATPYWTPWWPTCSTGISKDGAKAS